VRSGYRKLAREREQVLIAGDEVCALLLGEREQVVVAGISGTRRRCLRVGSEPCSLPQERDQCSGSFRDGPVDGYVARNCFLNDSTPAVIPSQLEGFSDHNVQ
jgi:hypothetical protein